MKRSIWYIMLLTFVGLILTTSSCSSDESSEEEIPYEERYDDWERSIRSSVFWEMLRSLWAEVPWDPVYQDTFIETCVSGAVVDLGKDAAYDYCECALVIVMERYPNPEDAGNLTANDIEDIVAACL